MPARVDPCLAMLVDKPPTGPDWAFEVKWDGYRLAVHIERGRVGSSLAAAMTGPTDFPRSPTTRGGSQ